MSLKYVDFYRINKLRKTKSTFKLLNDSKFMIMFQFDIDNDQKIFEILPLNGTVEAFHYTLITATFLTKKEGIFTLDVPCLFPYNVSFNPVLCFIERKYIINSIIFMAYYNLKKNAFKTKY